MYLPPNPTLWQGRTDSLAGERFFQRVHCLEPTALPPATAEALVLCGFACDTGIKRNLGRPGAAEGPDALRLELGKLPCARDWTLYDLGNIVCDNEDLEQAQSELASLVDDLHQRGYRSLVLGGGHEMAWGHYQGLAPHYPKLGIINLDAHFDLRPLLEGQRGSSGTPFRQIADYCAKQDRPFDYCCLGIQTEGNTESLWQTASALKVECLRARDIYTQNAAWQTAFLDTFLVNQKQIYLSFCLDVLAEAFAPGVSAPQPLGLLPWQVIQLLQFIWQSGKVVSLDIAELSPPLDECGKTARLAAQIVAELLNT